MQSGHLLLLHSGHDVKTALGFYTVAVGDFFCLQLGGAVKITPHNEKKIILVELEEYITH